MENLDFGNIAIGAVIVGILNLVIVVLTKTETILKVVERIKGVVGLDYRNRAKRSDDELRISKKHSQVAKERVRHTFVSMKLWFCKWSWTWSDNFEPINIKGYCLGNAEGSFWQEGKVTYQCDQPVYAYFQFSEDEKASYATLGISCTDHYQGVHKPTRATFQIFNSTIQGHTAEEMLLPIITKAIISERDGRIAREIRKLRLQFWR